MAKNREYPVSRHITARLDCIIAAKSRMESTLKGLKLYLDLVKEQDATAIHPSARAKMLAMIDEALAVGEVASNAICGDDVR